MTPFGRHVIERSKAEVIPEFTADIKHRMMVERAISNVASKPQHIRYGKVFIDSWAFLSKKRIRVADRRNVLELTESEDTKWGTFEPEDISYFRTIEAQYEDTGVLAFHANKGGTSTYHAIIDTRPITVTIAEDGDDVLPYSHINYSTGAGNPYILARAGIGPVRPYSTIGPTKHQTQTFVNSPNLREENSGVDSVISTSLINGQVSIPQVATIIEEEGKKTLHMINDKVQRCRDPRILKAAKVRSVASLALGSYWYRAPSAIGVRSFIQDTSGKVACWPGGIIGHRLKSVGPPTYSEKQQRTESCATITALGAIIDEEELLQNSVEVGANINKVIMGGRSINVDVIVTHLSSQATASLIIKVNGGHRYPLETHDEGTFLPNAYPSLSLEASPLRKEECITQLSVLMQSFAGNISMF
jgi:hypothetical protein